MSTTIPPQAPETRAVERAVLSALTGRIEPPAPAAGYQIGLLVVAAAMVLLPALYVALAGAVGWGVFQHAVHDASLLTSGRGGTRLRLFAYLAPIAVGVTLLVFMVKPLFARQAKEPDRRILDRRKEPLLFAFVERLCRVVGAPPPDQIQVDCNINASAGHLGLVSVSGSGLVLTIGLPLVAGLTLRQLAGVLAHEFGHFSQGAGMALTQLIRRVNAWFYRVVYERDAWDEALDAWCRDGKEITVLAVGWLARLCVWLTRRLLWLMMHLGHGLSCFLMRQMEFDADGYEARVAGSDAFEGTAKRLRMLSLAGRAAYSQLGDAWSERRLVQDLPGLIAVEAGSLSRSMVGSLEKGIANETTGWFDTHPCDRERIARAREGRHPGIFHYEAPASVLFRNFEDLSRDATREHYREVIGPEADSAQLVATDTLRERRREHEEGEAALLRYTQHLVFPWRPIFPGIAVLPEPDSVAAARLPEVRRRFEEAVPAARRALDQRIRGEEMARDVDVASALLAAGVHPDVRELRLPAATAEGIGRARDRAEQLRTAGAAELLAFDECLRERLLAGLAAPAAEEGTLEAAARRKEAGRCLEALCALQEARPILADLEDRFSFLSRLMGQARAEKDREALRPRVFDGLLGLRGPLLALQRALLGAPYPFSHGALDTTLSAHAVPELPAEDDDFALYEPASRAVSSLFLVYVRAMGRLAAMAELAETAAGLPRLPDPRKAE